MRRGAGLGRIPSSRVHDDDELTLDALTSGISVFQRKKGHRFSSDDVVTAWVAMQLCPEPGLVLDLGCGLGSVLLHIAWSAPSSVLVGVEAQAVSFGLLERNLTHNALTDRITVHHGDLRDAGVVTALGGPFDLITGTPPYFPATAATDAMDEQRAYARIEYRGGVEDYVRTAAEVLAPAGRLVLCGDAESDVRLERCAAAVGLPVTGRWVVVPRAGRRPLFSVWALRRGRTGGERTERVLTLRDAEGERTDDARALRAFSGFPERFGPVADPVDESAGGIPG